MNRKPFLLARKFFINLYHIIGLASKQWRPRLCRMSNSRPKTGDLLSSAALLVVDAQDCFIDTLSGKDAFFRRCAFAIDAAQTLGIRTLFTEQAPEKLGPTNRQLKERAQKSKVFSKRSFSALSAPGIETYLRDNEIYHVLVCGLETPICIYQTALQSIDEDIDATFLTDALGCRRPEDGEVAIEAIRQLDCQALPSETVFYSLLGSATHPRFRPFSKLVATYSNLSIATSKILSEPADRAHTSSPNPSKETAKRSGKKPRNPKPEKPESVAKRRAAHPQKKVAKKQAPQSDKADTKTVSRKQAGKKPAIKKTARKRPARKSAKQ